MVKKVIDNGKKGVRYNLVLNERAQLVLHSIIENYIQSAEPIGSRTLSKTIGITLSPATIRNIMSDLAELGYLIQNHTSAGRVPTDKAYRFYVNSLATPPSISEQIKEKISQVSNEQGSQVEAILAETVRMLAELTKFACVVSTPKASVSRLQRIELIKISEDRILVILVTKAGVVRDKIIFTNESHTQEFLNSVAEFLNDKFKDHSMQEIRKEIHQSMVDDRTRYHDLLAHAIRLGKKAFELNQPGEMLIDGQMNLLLDSHFHEQSSVRSLIDAFEQKSAIMKILDDSMKHKGVHIFIGIENDLKQLQDCSLITASYRNNQNVLGSIGVVGPTSMDYKRIISMVDYTAKILSKTITEQSYD
ncbi:MAG: heat-inducible transcriptional repressor HrcA [SAR324 cluster bacterium]|nr:heat-inducible transcriptional repressor HrcA [SAR324 cluster bacterium]